MNEPTSERFYRDLPSFDDFQRLGDDVHYSALPSDWYVVISDVRGSTKAIEQGRYQDVNTLGAASVAVLGNLGNIMKFRLSLVVTEPVFLFLQQSWRK